MWLLDDLVSELQRQEMSLDEARSKVEGIRADIRTLTAELFKVKAEHSLQMKQHVCPAFFGPCVSGYSTDG